MASFVTPVMTFTIGKRLQRFRGCGAETKLRTAHPLEVVSRFKAIAATIELRLYSFPDNRPATLERYQMGEIRITRRSG
jgi:hypothetical protein